MSYRAPAFAEALPELAAPGCTPERLAYLEEHGFLPQPLEQSGEALDFCREGCDRAGR